MLSGGIELPWPPSVNHYYRHSARGTWISRKGRAYREAICSMLRDNVPLLEGHLEITIDAYPPDKRRRDIDNILKCLLDSLQHAGVYGDDTQIKDLHCFMHEPCRPNGKVNVAIRCKTSSP